MDARTGRDAGDPRRQPGLHGARRPEVRREARRRSASRSTTASTSTRPRTSAHWNVPEAHPLESWGDARAYDGTVTHHAAADRAALRRTLRARSAGGVHVAAADRRSYAIVKDYWTRAFGGGGGWTIRTPTGSRSRTPTRSGAARCTTGSSRAPQSPTAARRRRLSPMPRRRQRAAPRIGRRRRARRESAPPEPRHPRLPAAAAPAPAPQPPPAPMPGARAGSSSSSGRIRRSGTAASRTTAGCRSCRSR